MVDLRAKKAGREMTKTVGLIVNPVAGMGGSVGLKGTDGEMYERALGLGAVPVTPKSTKALLSHIRNRDRMRWFVAPGKMGEAYVKDFDMPYVVIGAVGRQTCAEDTQRIAGEMLDLRAELLIFVGGDGTARDIRDAIGLKIPVVAVPSGVKVFSSVFAVSARAAAEMVDAFIEGTDVREEEALDIDEDAFREGRLASRLYGYLLVPNARRLLQAGKEASSTSGSSVETKREIAAYIAGEDGDARSMLKGIVRLNMNEMPHPPSQSVIKAAQRGLSHLIGNLFGMEVQYL